MNRLIVLQNIEREGPSLYSIVARDFGLDTVISRVFLGESIPTPDNQDVLLILGGPMGIDDLENPKFIWLRRELDLINHALESDIPIIGVCLGAQLLAYSAGGNVEPLMDPKSLKPKPEIGWSPIQFNINEIDEKSFQNQDFYTLHWHGDRILLPESANLLASSAKCKEQMFRIGSNAYGLQFHVEVQDMDVQRWIREDVDFIKLSFGDKAQTILLEQNKEYCNISQLNRLNLIRYIFVQLCG